MTNYRNLEKLFADHLRTGRRPIAVVFRDSPPDGVPPLPRLRAFRLQLLGHRRRRPLLLHGSGGPLQLPDWVLHPQYSSAGGPRQGARADLRPDDSNWIRPDGGGPRHSPVAEDARRDRLLPAGGCSARPRCRSVCGPPRRHDAASGGCPARWRCRPVASVRPVPPAWRFLLLWPTAPLRAPVALATGSIPPWTKGNSIWLFLERTSHASPRNCRRSLRPTSSSSPTIRSANRS